MTFSHQFICWKLEACRDARFYCQIMSVCSVFHQSWSFQYFFWIEIYFRFWLCMHILYRSSFLILRLILWLKNSALLQTVDVFAIVALSGIVSRLLSTGTVLVATSNRAPRELNQVYITLDCLNYLGILSHALCCFLLQLSLLVNFSWWAFYM